MSQSLDEFKEFVKEHPKLKFEVRDGKRTWQSIYEEWTLLGSDDEGWSSYKKEEQKSSSITSVEGQETLRTIIDYVKKVNPDTITKGLSTAQKVVSIVQGFNGSNKNQKTNYTPRRKMDPLFRRYDDDEYGD